MGLGRDGEVALTLAAVVGYAVAWLWPVASGTVAGDAVAVWFAGFGAIFLRYTLLAPALKHDLPAECRILDIIHYSILALAAVGAELAAMLGPGLLLLMLYGPLAAVGWVVLLAAVATGAEWWYAEKYGCWVEV